MSRLAGPDELDIVAAIRAGKTRQIIVVETGIAVSRINYIAEKYSLTIVSRYNRVRPTQGYWRRKLGRKWNLAKKSPPRSAQCVAESESELLLLTL